MADVSFAPIEEQIKLLEVVEASIPEEHHPTKKAEAIVLRQRSILLGLIFGLAAVVFMSVVASNSAIQAQRQKQFVPSNGGNDQILSFSDPSTTFLRQTSNSDQTQQVPTPPIKMPLIENSPQADASNDVPLKPLLPPMPESMESIAQVPTLELNHNQHKISSSLMNQWSPIPTAADEVLSQPPVHGVHYVKDNDAFVFYFVPVTMRPSLVSKAADVPTHDFFSGATTTNMDANPHPGSQYLYDLLSSGHSLFFAPARSTVEDKAIHTREGRPSVSQIVIGNFDNAWDAFLADRVALQPTEHGMLVASRAITNTTSSSTGAVAFEMTSLWRIINNYSTRTLADNAHEFSIYEYVMVVPTAKAGSTQGATAIDTTGRATHGLVQREWKCCDFTEILAEVEVEALTHTHE